MQRCDDAVQRIHGGVGGTNAGHPRNCDAKDLRGAQGVLVELGGNKRGNKVTLANKIVGWNLDGDFSYPHRDKAPTLRVTDKHQRRPDIVEMWNKDRKGVSAIVDDFG